MIESERKAIVLFTRFKIKNEKWIQQKFLNNTKSYFDWVRLGNNDPGMYRVGRELNYFMLDFKNSQVKRLASFVGIEEKHLPFLVVIKFDKATRQIKKYSFPWKLEKREFTEDRYWKFIVNSQMNRRKFNRVISRDRIKYTNTNFINQGYYTMKGLLIYPNSNMEYLVKESLRDHVIVSYVARYCNHCLRLQPVMDRLSLRFTKSKDGIIFNRYDLDQNDFGFLEFDKVPLIMFYPKGVHAKGVEVKVFDKNQDTLPENVIYKQIRKLMRKYDRELKQREMNLEQKKTDL